MLVLTMRIFCGEPHPYRVSLSDVKVIVAFMCVLVGESLYQVLMGQIPALECLLPAACGSQWLHLVLSNIKWPCRPRAP
jgi:hypothetical protein